MCVKQNLGEVSNRQKIPAFAMSLMTAFCETQTKAEKVVLVAKCEDDGSLRQVRLNIVPHVL